MALNTVSTDDAHIYISTSGLSPISRCITPVCNFRSTSLLGCLTSNSSSTPYLTNGISILLAGCSDQKTFRVILNRRHTWHLSCWYATHPIYQQLLSAQPWKYIYIPGHFSALHCCFPIFSWIISVVSKFISQLSTLPVHCLFSTKQQSNPYKI